MKKRLFLTVAGFFCILLVQAQNPVGWDFSAIKTGVNTYEIRLHAALQPGWHLYSQQQPADAIALPTEVQFNPNPLLSPNGPVLEKGEKELHRDATLDTGAWQYEKEVVFVQKMTAKAKAKTQITGSITYQVCTDEKCLPPSTQRFSITLQ